MMARRIDWQRHDLAEGAFDLVTAAYLQSPVAFPRAAVLRRAVGAVADGGRLLIVEHASGPPWAGPPEERPFPTLEGTLAALELDAAWTIHVAEVVERLHTASEGQTATVTDNLIFVARR